MPDQSFLSWPFFADSHRELAHQAREWVQGREHEWAQEPPKEAELDKRARAHVRELGQAGWLNYVANEKLDVRSICLIRETLAYASGFVDFAFVLQGLGTAPISLFGSKDQKQKYLPSVARGEKIAAFALSEKEAGSDVAAMQTSARRDAHDWIIDGEKSWISNAGIADHYLVFARLPQSGPSSFAAFVVPADSRGLTVSERLTVIAPHVLGTVKFERCRVAEDALIGEPGKGLKIALATLDVFRTTVGAAALGFARRALDEAVRFTRSRQTFGKPLAEQQLTQARIANMALQIDAAALLIYRAAWLKDSGAPRITREAAMAKLFATESAQRVIDDSVQLHGGRGVLRGETVERLYREIRALRIYEGTSEIQQLIIAGQVFANAGA